MLYNYTSWRPNLQPVSATSFESDQLTQCTSPKGTEINLSSFAKPEGYSWTTTATDKILSVWGQWTKWMMTGPPLEFRLHRPQTLVIDHGGTMVTFSNGCTALKKFRGRLELTWLLSHVCDFDLSISGGRENWGDIRCQNLGKTVSVTVRTALEKLTADSTCRLPSYQRAKVHAVAPFALANTALLKSFCCDAWKVATDKDGREAEKVTAQQETIGEAKRNKSNNNSTKEVMSRLPETTELLGATVAVCGGGGLLGVTLGLMVVAATTHLPLVHVEPLVAQSVGRETNLPCMGPSCMHYNRPIEEPVLKD